MKLNIKQLYLYGISAATLIMVIIGIIQFGEHIVNLIMPLPQAKSPGGDISNIYDKRGIISSLVQIVVAFPVYLYHWKQARKSDV